MSSSHSAALLVPPPEEVLDGIWQVRIPLEVRTEPCNAWILRDGAGGLLVFDTGVANAAEAMWRGAFDAIGHQPSDVRTIVVSHHHPDHIGGSAALHRLTGARLLASASTIAQGPDVWGDRGRLDSYFDAVEQHLAEHGVPVGVLDRLRGEPDLVRAAVQLPPDEAWEPVGEGDAVELDGRTWRVRLTPGHADGHLVLHANDGLLLAGDHLLERISPAVGRFPRHERDPLARYLESLMTVAMLDVTMVLPGHGAPFTGARERARWLVDHHLQRIDACVDAVAAHGPASAWDVAQHVFPKVFGAAPPDPANQRFATTESLAHLERARRDGRLTRARDDDSIVRFRVGAG